uniref:Uncharacterized protein n=1 Tax=Siphoviridae sp. ctnpt50 TaxID=2827941 RepID=A0A8S5SD74_9CAUD|nr:MAG TPA: hypothetical protein [Siphoviridae sp. ctnpt50]
MFGWKAKYQTERTEGNFYLDGMAVTTSLLIGRGEMDRDAKLIAYGIKKSMENFAERFNYHEKLKYLYELYPEIKNLKLEEI